MATVTVLYPTGAKFDLDYYKKTHMPLVQEHWGPQGLKSWQVTQFGPDSQYQIQALLQFDSITDFQKAASSESAQIVMGDVKNFTDSQPVLIAGEVVQSS